MGEISIFVDESGDQGGMSKYYALTLVFHDQSHSLEPCLGEHLKGLRARGLRDIPFHANPILNGHDAYKNMDFSTRKAYFMLFFQDVQHLPISYHAFLYRRKEYPDRESLAGRMKRDVVNFLFDNLDYFQSFGEIKIYYDNGQDMVAQVLREAIGYALSKNGLLYRTARADRFTLSQAADMLCTLELTAVKYERGEQTRTDEMMFGSARAFKRNYFKAARRMRLSR